MSAQNISSKENEAWKSSSASIGQTAGSRQSLAQQSITNTTSISSEVIIDMEGSPIKKKKSSRSKSTSLAKLTAASSVNDNGVIKQIAQTTVEEKVEQVEEVVELKIKKKRSSSTKKRDETRKTPEPAEVEGEGENSQARGRSRAKKEKDGSRSLSSSISRKSTTSEKDLPTPPPPPPKENDAVSDAGRQSKSKTRARSKSKSSATSGSSSMPQTPADEIASLLRSPGDATGNEDKPTSPRKRSKSQIKRKSKSKSKSNPKLDQPANSIFSNIGKTPQDFVNHILSIHVNKTDALEANVRILHPVVRVHVVDIRTGQYIKKSASARRVTSPNENSGVEHILPVLTKTYSLQKHRSITPQWDEEVVLNEDYLHIVQENVMVMFEILDFASHRTIKMQTNDGWYRFAWGFLKLVGGQKQTNTEQKVRLQLYRYPELNLGKGYFSIPFFSSQTQEPAPGHWTAPHVWRCWQYLTERGKLKEHQYPATLYVCVKARPMLTSREVFMRPVYPTDVERGKLTYEQLMDTYTSKAKKFDDLRRRSTINTLANSQRRWRRTGNQKCKIPNKLMYSINAGSSGCISTAFSNSGSFFAASCVHNSSYPIKIFDVISGEKLLSLEGHQDLVYELVWSEDDEELLSASSDGSVRVWSLKHDSSVRLAQVYQHPCFVYTTQWHPIAQSGQRTVVTGGYDKQIRMYRFDPYDKTRGLRSPLSPQTLAAQSPEPFRVLRGHDSYVNSIVFESSGTRFYSGDGAGMILIWSNKAGNDSVNQFDNYECIKCVNTLQSVPITSLRMHPNGRKLLVHSQNNCIRTYDIRIYKFLTDFNGIVPGQAHIKSIWSPCGNYVFSGTEKGKVYVWNADTGSLVAVYNNLSFTSPIVDISFHPLDHIASFTAFGDHQPILMHTWDSEEPPVEAHDMDVVESASEKTSEELESFLQNLKQMPSRSTTNVKGIMDTSLSVESISAKPIALPKQEVAEARINNIIDPFQSPTAVENVNPFSPTALEPTEPPVQRRVTKAYEKYDDEDDEESNQSSWSIHQQVRSKSLNQVSSPLRASISRTTISRSSAVFTNSRPTQYSEDDEVISPSRSYARSRSSIAGYSPK